MNVFIQFPIEKVKKSWIIVPLNIILSLFAELNTILIIVSILKRCGNEHFNPSFLSLFSLFMEYKPNSFLAGTMNAISSFPSQEKKGEDEFRLDIFNDRSFSNKEKCQYFLDSSYANLLKSNWFTLLKFFSNHIGETKLTNMCLCIVLRYLSTEEKKAVVPIEKILKSIKSQKVNPISLTLASLIGDAVDDEIIDKETLLVGASGDLGEFYVRILRSQYHIFRYKMTEKDVSRLLPLNERSIEYRAAVFNFFKIAVEFSETCRIGYLKEIAKRQF
jgi:hypothetical protein